MRHASGSGYAPFVLTVVFLYICLGNLPRIMQIPGFNDNLVITEFLLYLVLLGYALLSRSTILALRKTWLVVMMIVMSFLYGTIMNGFEAKAFLYTLRLLLLLFTAVVAGEALFRLYRRDSVRALMFLLRSYLMLFLISLVIYLAFPDSAKFWEFLSRFGIVFNGDPHLHRFVSTYLDPNYYSAIACIPMIIGFHLYRVTESTRFLFAALIFVVSAILSGSRSGIASVVVMLVVANFRYVLSVTAFKMKKSNVVAFIGILVLGMVISPLYIDNLITTVNRVIGIGDDQSAFARLISFQYGMQLFEHHPVLGVGYNYLAVQAEQFRGLSSVDSSLLATLINFGLLLTTLLAVFLLIWAYTIWTRFAARQQAEGSLFSFINVFLAYILVAILFTSQFNNLLYYQFWLFPTVMIATYLSRLSQGGSNVKSDD